MTRFEKSAKERQRALDYINANPGCYAPDVVAAMKWNKSMGAGRLAQMETLGEVRREAATITRKNSLGVVVPQHTFKYWGLKKFTRQPDAVIRDLASNLAALCKVPETATRVAGKRYLHTDPHRRPLPYQGGQGCVGDGVKRASSLEFI